MKNSYRAQVGLAEVALSDGKLAHVIHHYNDAVRIAPDKAAARLARREADYYSRLNTDEDYLAAELRRMNWLEGAGRVQRVTAAVEFRGVADCSDWFFDRSSSHGFSLGARFVVDHRLVRRTDNAKVSHHAPARRQRRLRFTSSLPWLDPFSTKLAILWRLAFDWQVSASPCPRFLVGHCGHRLSSYRRRIQKRNPIDNVAAQAFRSSALKTRFRDSFSYPPVIERRPLIAISASGAGFS